MTPNDFITAKETAQRLHVAVGTLKRWRRSRVGPPWCRLGTRGVRYRVASLEAWVSARVSQSTSSPTDGAGRPDPVVGIIPIQAAGSASTPPRSDFLINIRPYQGE